MDKDYQIERPRVLTVMAIFHLLFAFTGLFRWLANKSAMKTLLLEEPGTDVGLPASLLDAHAVYFQSAKLYHTLDNVAALLLMIMLIISGVSLLRNHSLGCKFSFAYAVSSIVLRIGLTFGYTAMVNTKHIAYLRLVHEHIPDSESVMPIPNSSVWLLGILVAAIYPVLVLYYLRRDEVKEYQDEIA